MAKKKKSRKKKQAQPNFRQLISTLATSNLFEKHGVTANPLNISYEELDSMRFDGDIRAALLVIKMPIQSIKWWIECEDTKIQELVQTNLEEIWGEFIRSTLRALDFGYAPHEKLWLLEDGVIKYKKFLDIKPNDGIKIQVNPKTGQYEGFYQMPSYSIDTKDAIFIPSDKSFVFSNEIEFGNLYGVPRTRAAYPYYFISKVLLGSAGMYYERFGSPIIEGWAPPGSSEIGEAEDGTKLMRKNIQILQDHLQSLQASGTITLPFTENKSWGFKIHESQQRGPDFVNFFKWLGVMKQLAVFVPELLYSQGRVGSLALGRQHAETFMVSLEGLVEDLKTHIDKFVIPQLVAYNFGTKTPKCEWMYKPFEKLSKELMRDLFVSMEEHRTKLVEGKDSDFNIDYKQIASDLGIPMADDVKPASGGGTKSTKATTKDKKEETKKISLGTVVPSLSEEVVDLALAGNSEYWRELFPNETKIDFKAIEMTMDTAETIFVKKANSYIDLQISSLVMQILKALKSDNKIAMLKNLRSGRLKDIENLLKTHMSNMFELGKVESAKELGVKVEPTPKDVRDLTAGRAKAIAHKHCSDMEYTAYLTALENLHKSPKEAVSSIRSRLEKFKGATQ